MRSDASVAGSATVPESVKKHISKKSKYRVIHESWLGEDLKSLATSVDLPKETLDFGLYNKRQNKSIPDYALINCKCFIAYLMMRVSVMMSEVCYQMKYL